MMGIYKRGSIQRWHSFELDWVVQVWALAQPGAQRSAGWLAHWLAVWLVGCSVDWDGGLAHASFVACCGTQTLQHAAFGRTKYPKSSKCIQVASHVLKPRLRGPTLQPMSCQSICFPDLPSEEDRTCGHSLQSVASLCSPPEPVICHSHFHTRTQQDACLGVTGEVAVGMGISSKAKLV